MDFTIEELSMNAWPAIKTVLYDGWIIRLAGGYGNRANSVNPVYPSKIGLEEKIAYCDDYFSRHNLPAAYKLLECKEHETIEKKLAGMNYGKINETSIQTFTIPENFRAGYKGIVVEGAFGDEWKNSVIAHNGIARRHAGTFKKIVDNIDGEKIVVRKVSGGETAGCGYGAIGRGYVGVFDIVVKESLRGKGYGREIVSAILAEAAARGVKESYLQVMISNPAALCLYKKLGYRELYRYWYRKKTEE